MGRRTWDACIQCGRVVPANGPIRCGRCRTAPRPDHLAVLAALQEEYDLEAAARHRRILASLA